MGAIDGSYSRYGRAAGNAVRLAIDQANESGDLACWLDVHAENTEGDPNRAPRKAQTLINDEELVACVCGFFSGETLATGMIFSEGGVAMLSTGEHYMIDNQGFETWFRAIADDDAQADSTAVYIKRVLDGRKVSVVHDTQGYSKHMAKRVVRGLGRRFSGPIFVINPEETDHSAVVSQLKNKRPDVVFFGGYSPMAWELAHQMRQAGVQARFVTDSGAHDAREARELYPKQRAVLSSSVTDASSVPSAEAFVAAFEDEYGVAPDYYAPDTYDVTNIVIDSLRELSGAEPTEEIRAHVVAHLEAVEGYEGVVKSYSWADNGELEAGNDHVWIWRWGGRRFSLLGTVAELAG